ncbi:hypothetical protein LSAT2_019435 [Lamellibrachia satsuma]|nr:hypothetical protein LSAT2_019435 [Lamellibrachia satsuma]
MGALFRSEEMSLCQLYLQSEAAYTCVSELGELGLVQFRDLNADVNAFQRKFVSEIQRCEEMERQLRYFGRELRKEGIPIYDPCTEPEAPAPRDMIDLEATYESHEVELRTLGSSLEALESNLRSLKELKCVLQHAEVFFLESGLNIATDASETLQGSQHIELEPMSEDQRVQHQRIYLSFVAGMVESARLPGFSRLLWFACKGNVFLRHMDIPELSVGSVRRAVFIVFFQGDQLKEKVKKICDGFKATMYPCPESRQQRSELFIGLTRRVHEVDLVLQKSREQWLRVLESVAQNLHHWNIKVLKIKAIYHTLNMLSTEGTNYIAECWMPVSNIGSVQLLMNRATVSLTTAHTLYSFTCVSFMPLSAT